MRIDRKAFTLTEMLVVFLVTGIIVLMIGAMASMAYKSYNDLRKNAGVYDDSLFALQMIRENVRHSTSSALSVPATGCLKAGTHSFYVSGHNLVDGSGCGVANCTCTSSKSLIANCTTGPTFTPANTPGSALVTVALSGTKDNISFSYSIEATRRNP